MQELNSRPDRIRSLLRRMHVQPVSVQFVNRFRFGGIGDNLRFAYVQKLRNLPIGQPGLIHHFVEQEPRPVRVNRDARRRVVRVSEVQPVPKQTPFRADFLNLDVMVENGTSGLPAFPQSVDAPKVRIGILQAFDFCNQRRVQMRVVLVCRLKKRRIVPRDYVVINPMEFFGRVVVK